MASVQKTATSCEVDEEEYEDYEEEEIEEDVEGEEYEEEIEEGVYEEEEEEEEEEVIEQDDEEEEKKVIEVQKLQEQEEEEESAKDPVREEEKSSNPEQQSESERNAPVVFPPFLQSVSDLEKLHCALSKFLYQWNSLNRSLDSISAAIDAHAPPQHDARSIEQKKDERREKEKEKEKGKDERSWVEILCEEMQGKSLRKYIESNFSDLDRLRYEVPEALRGLQNPAKLVFEAIGKFYTQGKKAYSAHSSPLVSYRRASILLLEFFVLSGRPTEDSSVKEDAMHGALLWRNRLVHEDIESASAVDSLGLILFLACFGIPKGFGSKDLCLLLLKSNLKKKGDLFRRSSILVEGIPGVIKDLIREEMYVEAAELSYCFGLSDTFPPLPLLSSFVVKVTQIGKQEQHESKGSPRLLKEANIKELISLKSVVKCVEDCKLDIHMLASGNIHQKILRLEKYIENDETRFKAKILKRNANHLEVDKKSETQSKESFHSISEASQNTPSQMMQDKPEKGLPAQPLLPDSRVENSALSAAASNNKDYPYGWENTYHETSAGYRSSAMEYPTAQHFYQTQASVNGNGGGISGRNLYQFADTVIQHESQLSKSNRSSNTSPAGAKFGHN